MSVPYSERGLSKMEFYHQAVKLRKEITFLLLRDFGIKPKTVEFDRFAEQQRMTDEDKDTFANLMEKYAIGEGVTQEFPAWFINKERDLILKLCNALVMNIAAANTIYFNYEAEYIERRLYIDRAIISCEQILQELQFVMSIIPVNINKLIPYVDMIDNEIALLKGLRKSDNKRWKQLQKEHNKQ